MYKHLLDRIQQNLTNNQHFDPNLSSIVSLITYKQGNSVSYSLITGDAHAGDILFGLKNQGIKKFRYVEGKT